MLVLRTAFIDFFIGTQTHLDLHLPINDINSTKIGINKFNYVHSFKNNSKTKKNENDIPKNTFSITANSQFMKIMLINILILK